MLERWFGVLPCRGGEVLDWHNCFFVNLEGFCFYFFGGLDLGGHAGSFFQSIEI